MKTETIQFELPKEIMESARKVGFTKERLGDLSKSFAILEVVANSTKLNEKDAERISNQIKAVSWKKIKKKLEL